MTYRIHNFCAGPCTLPLEVLQEAQTELLNFQNSGMSVLEISHRSKRFEEIHFSALALAQELIAAPKSFKTLLLPGGAHQQFVMSAQNLLADGGTAAFVNSGVWANKALQEALRAGQAEEIWNGKDNNFKLLPKSLQLEKDYRYLHLTSNETVNGLQFKDFPQLNQKVNLVIDASSDYYTREIPWQDCAIVYGGVQKNLAPSGLALVFVREDLLVDHKNIAKFLTYHAHASADSLYNTPPTWQIYIFEKVLLWMKKLGGIEYFQAQSIEKSKLLYDFIDKSDFYNNDVKPEFRSRTNVVFKTPNEKLDTDFYKEAEKAGFNGLKGHKLVGGLRASLYNALELSSVEALCQFMADFAEKNK